MTAGDHKVERAADKLQALANNMAAEGGLKSKLAGPLAEDADFLRKLKPSLIKARARGQAPTDQAPQRGGTVAPSGPQLGQRPAPKPKRGGRGGGGGGSGGGPNPWVIAGVALAAGILLAKWIDWRGHAHPRD
jgi:hypothetical protein